MHSALVNVRRYYDGVAAGYDELYGDMRAIAENEVIAQKIEGAFAKPTSVLDLGCGTGLGRRLVTCEEYFGIDLSGKMLALAREKYPGEAFQQEAIECLELKRSYDVVVSLFGVMSHLTDPGLQVRRLAHWASRGAFLMFYGEGSRCYAKHLQNVHSGGDAVSYVTRKQVLAWMQDAFETSFVSPFDSGFKVMNGTSQPQLVRRLMTEYGDSAIRAEPRYWIAVGHGRKT